MIDARQSIVAKLHKRHRAKISIGVPDAALVVRQRCKALSCEPTSSGEIPFLRTGAVEQNNRRIPMRTSGKHERPCKRYLPTGKFHRFLVGALLFGGPFG